VKHPRPDSPFRPVLSAIGWFFALSCLSLAATGLAALDMFVLRNGMGEQSLTETTQIFCVLVSALCFLRVAIAIPRVRGFAWLVSGAFFVMAVREQDYAFDFYFHGAWFFPALAVFAISVASALQKGTREGILPAAAEFCRTPSAYFLISGFVLLLVFSRVFTSRHIFWKHLLPPEASFVKTCFQEGLELMGYVFIASGAVRYSWHILHRRETDAPSANS
jgi:hypothetical protein